MVSAISCNTKLIHYLQYNIQRGKFNGINKFSWNLVRTQIICRHFQFHCVVSAYSIGCKRYILHDVLLNIKNLACSLYWSFHLSLNWVTLAGFEKKVLLFTLFCVVCFLDWLVRNKNANMMHLSQFSLKKFENLWSYKRYWHRYCKNFYFYLTKFL